MSNETSDVPRIYVASLSDYNDGILHGEWIDLDGGDTDEVWDQINVMLKASPYANSHFARRFGMKAEEWAIHDYEGFGDIKIGEWEDINKLVGLGALITEHGYPFTVWYTHFDGDSLDLDEMGDQFEEQYRGEWDSKTEYAMEFAESVGYLAEMKDNPLSYYIDWDAWAESFEHGGTYFHPNGSSVLVFESY